MNIANALYEYYEIYIITTDTDHRETNPYQDIESNEWNDKLFSGMHIYYVNKASITKRQLKYLIQSVKADYVYLNHLFSPFFVVYPLWLKWRNKVSGKIILCPRGALHKSAIAEKGYKKLPFIFLFKFLRINKLIRFHATNEKERNEIEQFFPGSNIYVANNLPDRNQQELFISKKNKGEIKCLFISRIVPIKNLLYLLQVLNNADESISLTIAGPVEDENYWNVCCEKIKSLTGNISVTYIGSVKKEDVQKVIQEHHLIVLPTTGENFGHSIFESFLAGRPVLISDQTPWRQLEEKNIGWDISLSKPEQFRNVIRTVTDWDQEKFNFFARKSWKFANDFINDPHLVDSYKVLFS